MARTTKDGKGQDEDHNLSATVERGRDNVVVLDEEHGLVLAQVPLSEDTEEEEHGDGRVDTDKQVSHLPQDDRSVGVLEDGVWVVLVQEPEGNGNEEAEQVGDRDLRRISESTLRRHETRLTHWYCVPMEKVS